MKKLPFSKICGKEMFPQSVFPSTEKQIAIQKYAIENVWSGYPLVFGPTPEPPISHKNENDGNWLLSTHFGDDVDLSSNMIIEAINKKSHDCGTGIIIVFDDNVKDVLRDMVWHRKKPAVLSLTEVTQEWVWVSFRHYDLANGIVPEYIVDNLSKEYPAGNEGLCALLMSDELVDLINQKKFPDPILTGFYVIASIDEQLKQEYCLQVSSDDAANKRLTYISLHPMKEIHKGVALVCSQYI